jgi:hypothetical protein
MIKTREKKTVVKQEKTKEAAQTDLQLAAYFHWRERGCPVNDDLTDWLAVEKGNGKKESGFPGSVLKQG